MHGSGENAPVCRRQNVTHWEIVFCGFGHLWQLGLACPVSPDILIHLLAYGCGLGCVSLGDVFYVSWCVHRMDKQKLWMEHD